MEPQRLSCERQVGGGRLRGEGDRGSSAGVWRPGGQSELSPAAASRNGLANTVLLPTSDLRNRRIPRLWDSKPPRSAAAGYTGEEKPVLTLTSHLRKASGCLLSFPGIGETETNQPRAGQEHAVWPADGE